MVIVAVDLDDVLCPFLPTFVAYHNRVYGTQLGIADFSTLNYSDALKTSSDEATTRVFDFYQSAEFQAIPPFQDAQEVLIQWKREHRDTQFVIVTSRPSSIEQETLDWVDRHFPSVFTRIILCNHFARDGSRVHSKGDICAELGADWFVDDHAGHVAQVQRSVPGIRALVFDRANTYPWSKFAQTLERVDNWTAVYEHWIASRIEWVPLQLPGDCIKQAFVLNRVLTPHECGQLIRQATELGYQPRIPGQPEHAWNHERCIVTDAALAERIFQRVKAFLPSTVGDTALYGLNEQLKFLRYAPGQRFAPHVDGQLELADGRRSRFTLQLYLNEVFEGGETQFIEEEYKVDRAVVNVRPRTGMALVFEQDLLHAGNEVTHGAKYNIRTDVMYR